MAEAIRMDQMTTLRDGNICASDVKTSCCAKRQSNSFESLDIEEGSDAEDVEYVKSGTESVSSEDRSNDEDIEVTNNEVSIIIIHLINFSSHPVSQLAASLPSKTLPAARAKRGSKRCSECQTHPAASHANTTYVVFIVVHPIYVILHDHLNVPTTRIPFSAVRRYGTVPYSNFKGLFTVRVAVWLIPSSYRPFVWLIPYMATVPIPRFKVSGQLPTYLHLVRDCQPGTPLAFLWCLLTASQSDIVWEFDRLPKWVNRRLHNVGLVLSLGRLLCTQIPMY
jgi:hypothetical protein